MALKTKVKVGKITNLSDARYCAGMGVDLLGFPAGNLHDPDRSIREYKEITGWLSGPHFVLEWEGDNVPTDFIPQIAAYPVHFLEIAAEMLKDLPRVQFPLIVRLDIREWTTFREVLRSGNNTIAYIELTSEKNIELDPSLITQIGREFSVLLGFGVTPENLTAILALPIAGISLQGTDENVPGLKDYTTLSEVLELLELID